MKIFSINILIRVSLSSGTSWNIEWQIGFSLLFIYLVLRSLKGSAKIGLVETQNECDWGVLGPASRHTHKPHGAQDDMGPIDRQSYCRIKNP